MKIRTLLLLPLLAAPLAAQTVSSADDVKREIDLSLRWLRYQQDLKTGSYGSVELTALAVKTFAESPRHYGISDGPFVSKGVSFLLRSQRTSGAICDPGATVDEARAQSAEAAAALRRIGIPEALAAAEKAEEFAQLFDPGDEWPAEEALAGFRTDQLLSSVNDMLERREPEGYWTNARGVSPIFSTAIILERLSSYHQVIEARQKENATAEPLAPLPAFTPGDREKALKSLERGAAFLLAAADEEGRFGFGGYPDPGITSMAVGALLSLPEPRPEEVRKAIDGGLDWLVGLQQPDGSIHLGQLANYVTSASILALTSAGREGDEEVVAKARRFLQRLQADEAEGYGLGDRFYGGVGYGGDERPDLSNLQMALDALHAANVPADDPTFQKALTFLQRCQNRSESNDGVLAQGDVTIRAGDDGGAGYAPGESKAGYVELSDGTKVPRSYGSMTYALLKGYLFAGLAKDDPRVEAAWKWLRANYTLDVNPGFDTSSDPRAAYQGLYYYFYTMAKALDLYGDEVVVDAADTEHPWRIELVGRIASLQRQDGSWINENAERWYEGNPVLATAYAMLTLGVALPAE